MASGPAPFEEHGPSYLITDWPMPKMNGLELCRRVRAAKLPHYTYIIVITARSTTEGSGGRLAGGR